MDLQQRKRMQNRLAQRTYREKMKRRMEDLERWRDLALVFTGLDDDARLEAGTEQGSTMNSGKTLLSPHSVHILRPGREYPNAQASSEASDPLSSEEPLSTSYGVASSLSTSNVNMSQAALSPHNPVVTQSGAEFDFLGDADDTLANNLLPTPGASATPAASMEIDFCIPHRKLDGPSDPCAYTNGIGKIALHLAAECNQVAVVRLLLRHMSDPNIRDEQGKAALHLAVERNRFETVEVLLGTPGGGQKDVQASSVDVNIQDQSGRSALHIAVVAGLRPIVKLLLQTPQIDANLKDCEGYSPLHRAALAGFDGVVELLLEHGADTNLMVGC